MLLALILASSLAAGPDDFDSTWNSVASGIRTGFYARDREKAEIEALLTKYGPTAKAAKSHREFGRSVNQMIEEFKASHFAFLTDDDQGYYLMDSLVKGEKSPEMPEFGAWFAEGPNGYSVKMVLNGSEAAKAGLRKGDVVVSVDGEPFQPIASLRDRVGKTATLSIRRSSEDLTAKIKIEKEQCLDMFLEASKDSVKVFEKNGRKIGYFHLWTQANSSFRDALSNAVYGKLKETDAMILDLRDGFGGRPEGYADPFFRPDAWLDWKTGNSTPIRQLFGYGRPLVVLINEGSRSAKEVLSDILKRSKRATLIGQRTAGNVLGTFPRRINDWSYLELPMVDVTVDGERLEGNGVVPDVTLPREFNDAGEDLDLSAALDRLATVPKYRAKG